MIPPAAFILLHVGAGHPQVASGAPCAVRGAGEGGVALLRGLWDVRLGSARPEDRATLRSDLSAVVGAVRVRGRSPCPAPRPSVGRSCSPGGPEAIHLP